MNVLMLVVDSLRADFAYSDRTQTPTLDTLRNNGVTFEDTIAGASWTAPSMSSIFSGIYPHRLGMYDFATPYPEGVQSLFEILSDEDFEVGSFVFDEEHLFSGVPSANVIDNFRDYEKPKRWIKNHSDDDFLLFVHHFWVHGPYEPVDSSQAWSEKNEQILRNLRENHSEAVDWCQDKYSDAVHRMSEEWLAGLLETLESCNIDDETLIVFTSDHGEGWGQRFDDPSVMDTNFHLHGKLLYDEHIRVPLVLSHPDGAAAGRLIEEQVRHVDLVPTILDLLDVDGNTNWQLDGESVASVFAGEEIQSRTAVTTATKTGLEELGKVSVREPSQKLIWNLPEETVELYDLDSDPGELNDLSSEQPDDLNDLKEKAEIALDEAPEDIYNMNSAAKDRLRDLGYL